jgi:ABC-type multidrug transport system fused ATPase/permease subunit
MVITMNQGMLKLTFPIVRSILWSNKLVIVLLIIISILLGVVPALKTDLEAGILQQAGSIISGQESKTFMGILGTPLSYFSQASSNSGGFDITAFIETNLFHGVSLGIAFISYLVIAILASLISFLSNSAQQKISIQIFAGLRGKGFQNGLVTDPSDLPTLPNVAGQYAEAIQQGALNISGTYDSLLKTGQYLFSLVTTLLLVATRGILFAFAILVIAIIQVIISIRQAHRLEEKRKKLDKSRNDLVAKTDDILDKREVILAYDQQNRYEQKLGDCTQTYAKIRQDINIQEEKYSSIKDLINDWGLISIIVVSLMLTFFLSRSSKVSIVGDIYFLIAIYWRILDPVSNILYFYDDIRRSGATSKTFLEVLEDRSRPNGTEQLHPPSNNSKALPSTQIQEPSIKFTNVSFNYRTEANQDAPQVLNNCSFEVPANAMTLIVGPSGIGKSTISRIILGFWPVYQGEVCIDGRELTSWQKDALRELMSYVAQTSNIIDDTIRENLSWGYSINKQPITDERMLYALAEVGIKYPREQATLEKNAKSLSGGEQQRLAIARLMLDESPIVILDEPLTGVDVFTLQELLPILVDKVLKLPNRTVLIFSHYLALAAYASHVIVLGDHGSVVEEGDPKQLIQADGIFAKRYQTAIDELNKLKLMKA